MPRIDVSVPTPDGPCPSTLHVPDAVPAPAVILCPDAGGARETMRAMADRLSGSGYVVLLPDVYHRAGDWTPFDVATVFTDPDERARMGELMSALTGPRIAADAGAWLDFLAARPEVSGDAVGTTGYCMGGRMSLQVAGLYPDRVAAAASFHGGHLAVVDDPESPVHLAERVRATVLVAPAQNDDAEQTERLAAAYTEHGVRHTVETYPADHGYAVPDNPTYDVAAEERHWTALVGLLDATLR